MVEDEDDDDEEEEEIEERLSNQTQLGLLKCFSLLGRNKCNPQFSSFQNAF